MSFTRMPKEASATDVMLGQFVSYVELLLNLMRTAAEDEPACDAARRVNMQLIDALEIQTLEARRESSRFDIENMADSRYLKAAVADELLLHTPWPGQACWGDYLLESALYRSNVAGDRIFELIEKILRDQEPAQRGLARLLLYALALGYEGRFRGEGQEGRLREYRLELYEFSYQRRPDLDSLDRVIEPKAYAHLLSHFSPRRFVAVSRGSLLFLIAVVGMLALSEIAWLWQSWPVRTELNHVESGN
ncbi:DotU family type IV/VI secretion system protein [Bordetella avium]|uniref:DotU family type IV/VI secretion system protein n=1 Tax=Bordetella avium TaxID=521 RepID=UPI0039FC82FD